MKDNILLNIFIVIIGLSIFGAIVAFLKEIIIEKKTTVSSIHKKHIYEKYFKRPLDAFLSIGAVLCFSPVLIILLLLVKIKLGSPVLFTQERPGLYGRIFRIYKFRTMVDKKDEQGNLLPDEDRITPFGATLRSTSLDELPELINIIKGDMSIVGPRPLLVQYLPLYNEQQARRHEVKPGLTGYAQVHGRNSITWEEKFEKDVYYVDHISLKTDISIIFQTIKIVIKRDGINSATSISMEGFKGTPKK